MNCANRYDLKPLANFCFDYVMLDLNAESVGADRCLQHLESAMTWSADIDNSLVENTLHYVDVHCKDVFLSERFIQLKFTTLRLILERDTLLAEDSVICKAVDRWAVALCARRNWRPSPANRRDALGELFYLIRFPVMAGMDLFGLPADALKEIRHHPHRFNTQPRRTPIIRVGDMKFRDKEEVFVERAENWCPAVVIGARDSLILCMMRSNNSNQVAHIKPEKVLRASAILALNQFVLHSGSGAVDQYKVAKYVRDDGDHHVIKLGRKEQHVQFSEIFLQHLRVKTWKKANEKSAKVENSKAPAKKRARDDADLT
ncbi:uncharacterized protein LOC129600536 [Paramacrobiotus metropolitanus]|uniref:uncharacterized protein LOC129600536 n=1 Tax=Paramacrobiotus metropolitanus TaxID=2943436 RepID=UPI0024456A90|nr:uncharacterized protein LOC129600536 [Paramacrobiotus metropolitanus]